MRKETPEQRQRRLDYLREWQAAHPGYAKAWREAHPGYNAARMQDRRIKDGPELTRRNTQKWRLKSKYGLALEDYDRMHAEQGGLCAICRRPETMKIKGTICVLAVDHDAATDRIRGLLCVNCNMLIGGAKHDPAILQAAIAYLGR